MSLVNLGKIFTWYFVYLNKVFYFNRRHRPDYCAKYNVAPPLHFQGTENKNIYLSWIGIQKWKQICRLREPSPPIPPMDRRQVENPLAKL
jgi:hypothetical protein